jgi:hypothetical protein
MRLLPLLPLLLMLAGCGSGSGSLQAASEEDCRKQAYHDPKVEAAIAAGIPGTHYTYFNTAPANAQTKVQDALQQATAECLRRRGIPGAGGVEPVKNYPFAF